MKQSAHGCDVEPPLITAANVGYGGAAIDDLAMTSLPLPLSPTCRHYDSPYAAVTWSRHHVIDDVACDGRYGTKSTAQSLCLRRHREVKTPVSSYFTLKAKDRIN